MSLFRRLQRVETSLTPKQAVLLWLKEAQQLGILGYAEKSLNSTMHEAPRARLTEMVGKAVCESLRKRGMKRELILRVEQEARKETDFLIVLIRNLHREVHEECSLDAPYIVLLYEKLKYRLEHYTQRAVKFEPEIWNIWRAILIHRLTCMRQLRETVVAISERYFAGHPLLFPEDANTLDRDVDSLEELTKHYNSLKAGLPAWTAIDIGALASSIREQLSVQVAERVAHAKATTLEDFGELEAGWKLMEPFAFARLKRLRASRERD